MPIFAIQIQPEENLFNQLIWFSEYLLSTYVRESRISRAHQGSETVLTHQKLQAKWGKKEMTKSFLISQILFYIF